MNNLINKIKLIPKERERERERKDQCVKSKPLCV